MLADLFLELLNFHLDSMKVISGYNIPQIFHNWICNFFLCIILEALLYLGNLFLTSQGVKFDFLYLLLIDTFL